MIGLKYNQGLLGEVRNLSHNVEQQFVTFSEVLNKEITSIEQELNYVKQGLSALVIVLILGFILQIARSINVQVSKLLSVMQMISNSNNISLRVELTGRNELVSIATYFNTLQVKRKGIFFLESSKGFTSLQPV